MGDIDKGALASMMIVEYDNMIDMLRNNDNDEDEV